jgi:hypothetical protein
MRPNEQMKKGVGRKLSSENLHKIFFKIVSISPNQNGYYGCGFYSIW